MTKTEKNWKGFYKYLTQELGLKEAGNKTLDSVFTKAPNKYKELEKCIGWMLFWKSLENTVSDTPDFQSWQVKGVSIFSETWTGTWTRTRTGTGTRTWTRTGTGTGTETGTETEIRLPAYEPNKNLWSIFRNKNKVLVFFEPGQINQFNQILEDYRAFEEKDVEMREETKRLKEYFVDNWNDYVTDKDKEFENETIREVEEDRSVISYANGLIYFIEYKNPKLAEDSKFRKLISVLRFLSKEDYKAGGRNRELEEIKKKLENSLQQKEIELNFKLKELKQENTNLETKLQNTNQELDEEKQNLLIEKKEQINFANSINELKEKLRNSTSSNQELENQKKIAEDQLTAITLSTSLLSNKVSELETKISSLENEKTFTENKITSLEEEIQQLLKIKSELEIENEALTKSVAELKIVVGRQKDQISALQGEQNSLNQQLEALKGELNLTPTSPEPEKQSLQEKITFFNKFLRKAQDTNIQLEENIKEEQRKSQQAQQSLLELEEQLKGTSEDNKQQIIKLNQANNDLRKQIKALENSLKNEKAQVVQLRKELAEKSAEMKKLGVILVKKELELNQAKKDKQWWIYAFVGVAVVVGLLAIWFTYQKIRRLF